MRCEVRVPASSANLGPGFDVLAVALGRYLSARYELDETIGELRVVVRPELHGGRNLVAEAMRYYASSTGRSLPGGTLTVDSDIPVARGLGSSAAAIVAGLVLANELCGEPLGRSELFRMACELEGHGDNVGAALFGGVVLAVVDEEGPQAVAVPVEFPLVAVVLVPDALGYTSDARAVLPRRVRRVTAVRTAAHTALLVLALATGQPDLLRTAMTDELHQPYRAVLYPHLEEAIDRALVAGAYGAALSGAGPSVLAFCSPERASAVQRAFADLLARRAMGGEALVLPIDRQGVQILRADERGPVSAPETISSHHE